MAHRPLQGVVVLDLTTALSGPYATMLLAGLGARVIKIEDPRTGGDSSRGNAPYVTRDGLSLSRTAPDDMSLSWVLRGRNKESVTLDLKTTQGAALLRELARRADVLVENYSAGVTQRLGISYDHLREFNPSLVYTSISGYGQQGRPGGDRAMDTIVKAFSGLMLTTSSPSKIPALRLRRLVLYIGTLTFSSLWRSGSPACAIAVSNVKEQPSRKLTKSLRQ